MIIDNTMIMDYIIYVECPNCKHEQVFLEVDEDYSIHELGGRHKCDKCDSSIWVTINVVAR